MNSKHSYLAKNVLLFSINGFVPKILSIILIPLYTNYLTPEEYGISDLIVVTVSLLIPIFTIDIQDAVMRFALDKKYDKKDVFSVAVQIIVSGTVLVCIGTFVVSFLHIPGVENKFLFFVDMMYFISAISNTISLFCRGIDKVDAMVIGSIMNSVVTLSTNILFLAIFNWGVTGYLLANMFGNFVMLVWCFMRANLYQYLKLNTHKNVRTDMVQFSFPLMFSVIAWWINNASDRYVLTWMSGVKMSGLYAISYKIPNFLSMFQNIFTQAWSISAIKEFDKTDSDGFISGMYNMMNFAMTIICSGIMIMNIPISKILYSKEFFLAWKYVPPLLISVVFNSMALFLGSIFTAIKDTKTLSFSTIIGAVINTVCNILLIFFIDAYGAALATMIGYVVVFAIRHIKLRKYVWLNINWRRDIMAYTMLVIQIIVAAAGMKIIIFQIIIFIIIVILFKTEFFILMKLVGKILLKHYSK